MRKSLLFLLAIMSTAVLLTGCNQPKGGTVGVVNTSRVYQESDAGKAGVKYLESLHGEMQGELTKMQEELQKNPGEDTTRKFQQLYAELQQRLGAEQQQVITKLNESLQRVLDSYRAQKGLDVIIGSETVLSASPAADITNEVIAEMNKTQVSFQSMKPEAKTAPAANGTDATAVPATEAPKAEPQANATAK